MKNIGIAFVFVVLVLFGMNQYESYKLKKTENDGIEAMQKVMKSSMDKKVNPNSTGIWSINHYIDKFGEQTKNKYITNKNWIRGKFSNSATQDSRLNVSFLINSIDDISIQLFEYAQNNPVKDTATDAYIIYIKDKNGKEYTLKGWIRNDRLKVYDPSDPAIVTSAKKLHNILMLGGKIYFSIDEPKYDANYYFIIENSDGYKNAYAEFNK